LEKHHFHRNVNAKITNFRYPVIGLEKPKGIIFMVHGYTDHLSNKAHIGKKFAEAGFDVVGLDLKGFGQSEGKRCYVKSIDDLMNQHL